MSATLSDKELDHIMGWCSAVKHQCWYDDNISGKHLSDHEEYELQREYISRHYIKKSEVVDALKDESEEYTSDLRATGHDLSVTDGTIWKRNQLRQELRAKLQLGEDTT